MKKFQFIYPKNLAYTAFILFVLIVFLLGYFYYFIPVNRQTIHKNGFLILKTVAANIQNRNASHSHLFTNFYQNADNEDTIAERIRQNNVKAGFRYFDNRETAGKKQDPITILKIEKDSFVYHIKDKAHADSLIVFEMMQDFLEPVLSSQKAELFESYAIALVKEKKSELIFQDAELGIRSDIPLDSLLPKTVQGYLSGTRDFSTGGFDYVMFYRPFQMDNYQLVLCGFVKAQKYDSNLKRVPFYFIYPLAIAFLLLLFFMPVLKFYIMNSNERVRKRDLILFGISVFTGAAVLTLVVIQFFLWKGEEWRVKQNLKALSHQIGNSFTKELEEAYDQLSSLDSFRMLDTEHNKSDYSDKVRKFLKGSGGNANAFYPFERISWINDSGMQIIKAELYSEPVFTNVAERKYFTAIQKNDFLYLADRSKKFGLEPLYSWTNADFNITISKKSDSSVAALATKMYSVLKTILPAGYGFCIIDKDGNVLLHSDDERNLRENLFEKAVPSDKIRGFAAARLNGDVNDVTIYGKTNILHIEPISHLPYSLVTFYDKGYIIPVNMRILMFALLFCFFSALTCIVLWLIFSPTRFSTHPIKYSPMDSMNWLRPTKDETGFYLHGLIYLVAYLILVLIFTFFCRSPGIHDFIIFSIVLFTPFNLVCAIFVIRGTFTNPIKNLTWNKLPPTRKKTLRVAITHLAASLLFYFFSRKSYPIDELFFFFQVFFNLWMWLYIFSKEKSRLVSFREEGNHLTRYSLMCCLLIICLAVLPSGLFTWYAHNQEIQQTIKKHQLHLANDVNQRAFSIIDKVSANGDSFLPAALVDRLLYREGIYTIHNDKISPQPDTTRNEAETFEHFYFAIAGSLRNPYDDPELYPALEDTAAQGWYWKVQDEKMHFWYRLPLHSQNTLRTDQSLHLVSDMPPRFVFLSSWKKLLWIIPLILFLCWALYKWLCVNTENVFLIKYHQKDSTVNSSESLVAKYLGQAEQDVVPSSASLLVDVNSSEQPATQSKKDLDEYEEQILEQMRKQKVLFGYIMTDCSEKERYLLYEFARHGIVNFKNKTEIYALMAKGLITGKNEKLQLFSHAFRAYLLTESETDIVQELQKKFHQNSTWQLVRGPLLLLLLGFLALIFFTQEAIFQKILALAAGAGTLISLIPKIFSGKSPAAPETK